MCQRFLWASGRQRPCCNFLGAAGHYKGVKTIRPGAPLDCASAQGLIDAFLLDELHAASSAALRVHLTGCAACAADLGGITRLLEVLAVAPAPQPSPDLDERIIRAAIQDRERRREHRSWLQDLRILVFRGVVRTTTTLAVTVIAVALLGATFVFAATNFLAGTAFNPTRGATVAPEVTPTLTPQQSATPAPTPAGTTRPVAVSATPAPTPAPVLTLEPTPTPAPVVTAEPTSPPAASAAPTPEPTPTPTEKPRRTPPPSPTETPAPTADVTPSP